jgi:hypothetical protein
VRYLIFSLGFLACAVGDAVADSTTIKQDRDLNYAIITVGPNKDVSDITIEQSGRRNGVTSVQRATTENSIKTNQSGWQNTVVIYQEGWIDISSVAQSAPKKKSNDERTFYQTQKTDDGYLTYFQSGGFSIATITEPGHTNTSRFGRSR